MALRLPMGAFVELRVDYVADSVENKEVVMLKERKFVQGEIGVIKVLKLSVDQCVLVHPCYYW